MNYRMLRSYFKYLIRSKNEYGVHSPFVYKLLTRCLYDKTKYPEYEILTKYRKRLIKDQTVLKVRDEGSPSRYFRSDERPVGKMAKVAGSSLKEMKLWFRLSRYFQPGRVLELGTHLGLSALAWSKGTKGLITTVEGNPVLYAYTKERLSSYIDKNVNFVLSDFEDYLSSSQERWDLVFIDGNHTYEATVRYFHLLKNQTHNRSLLVFHDIHWSEEMERAWRDIIADPVVHVTIDLFCCGLVFFREEQFKEHFVIRF